MRLPLLKGASSSLRNCVKAPPVDSSLDSRAQLQAVLGALEVVSLEAPVDTTYGALRARLEKASRPIGANDLFIAAQAMALGYTLVTDNERDFAQVKDFPRENWLRHI